ncbi:deoxyribodipyrimidine photo-lyase [Leminorella grimontii]|uniref:deoxyribodipyrimidine photo-lyase n=1 Tax=Leminorella grimontii TaxID=82981 RepID=UPI00321FF843
MATHLVWLRNDLRITDNKALHAACSDSNAKVLAVFIASPAQWAKHDMAPRQAAFIYQNLLLVQRDLAALGIELICHQVGDFAESVTWLADFCRRQRVTSLYYNRQYEVNERLRDDLLENVLGADVARYAFDDALLLPPGSVLTGSGEMFKVYTPFRNAFIRRLATSDVGSLPAPRSRGAAIDVEKLAPFDYPSADVDAAYPAGEAAALRRLTAFCREWVADYAAKRDLPAVDGTSGLSPYLAVGVLSPRQCFNRLRIEYPDVMESVNSGAFCWLNELIWREFYRHLIVAFPLLCKHRPFIGWTDGVPWRSNEQALLAWQTGATGYPIVDAAMRQLNSTGWMHNRLRMICASFLVKDLLIDWRIGERYFMQQLLDGDLAANNGGWQWAASTGTDAAPYFRIFNPTLQGKRFDPQGEFIRRWLPELAGVPGDAVHQPHVWAQKQRKRLDYPLPIVEHGQARTETLAAYEAARRLRQP